jgi:hypothetical protein
MWKDWWPYSGAQVTSTSLQCKKKGDYYIPIVTYFGTGGNCNAMNQSAIYSLEMLPSVCYSNDLGQREYRNGVYQAIAPAQCVSDVIAPAPAPAPSAPSAPVDDGPATVSLTLSGKGLWEWIKDNQAAFKTAFITDVSRIMNIDEEHITNVQAAEQKDTSSLLATSLLANQDVSVSFEIAAAASTVFTAVELGEQFKKSVNEGGETFTTLESDSGIEIEAEVHGVDAGSSAPAPEPAQASMGVGLIVGIAVASMCLVAVVVGAVFYYRKPAQTEIFQQHVNPIVEDHEKEKGSL